LEAARLTDFGGRAKIRARRALLIMQARVHARPGRLIADTVTDIALAQLVSKDRPERRLRAAENRYPQIHIWRDGGTNRAHRRLDPTLTTRRLNPVLISDRNRIVPLTFIGCRQLSLQASWQLRRRVTPL
jgi:hypothetical protein